MRSHAKGEPHETESADGAASSGLEQRQTGRPEDAVEVEGDMGDPNRSPANRKSQGPCPVQLAFDSKHRGCDLLSLKVSDVAQGRSIMHRAIVMQRRTKNLCAVQLLLGHTKLECTVRYLGIEVDNALEIAEQTKA
jgi:hypothetical protein